MPTRPPSLRLFAAGATAVTALALAALPASAATPAQQTATPSTTSGDSVTVTWTGTLPGGASTSSCKDRTTTSDAEKITLNIPASFYSTHTLLAVFSVTPNTPTADIILEVKRPDGSVATSDQGAVATPEVVAGANLDAGDYTATTCVFAGGPVAYTGKLTLTTDAPNGAPGGFGAAGVTTPTYTNYVSPPNLGNDAGEPSLGVDYTTNQDNGGTTLFQAGLEVLKATFDNSATPPAVTWTDVSPGNQNPCADISLDPIGEMDSQTGRYFDSQLAGDTSLLCYTDNDGASYNSASTGGAVTVGADHQTVGVGPYPAGFLPSGSNPVYPNAVYYCSQYLQGAGCSRSDNGGVAFNQPSNVYTSGVTPNSCGGLHGHISVAPDGTVYLPSKFCGIGQGVAVSTNAATTWQVKSIPTSTPGTTDPAIGVDAANRMYYGYVDGDGHPKIVTTVDRGATFTSPIDLGTPYGIQNAVFSQVVGGSAGRAAMAFLGTQTAGPNTQGFGISSDGKTYVGAEWHLYVATTLDGGATWTTVDATPKDPVQRGEICTGGIGCSGGTRNLLDFNDITLDKDGRVEVAYADGCTGACVTSLQVSDNPHTAKATIARTTTGDLLYTATPSADVPEAPLATLLPLLGLAGGGALLLARRRRRVTGAAV